MSFVLNLSLAAVAVLRRENSSSAINVFVFECVLSSLLCMIFELFDKEHLLSLHLVCLLVCDVWGCWSV